MNDWLQAVVMAGSNVAAYMFLRFRGMLPFVPPWALVFDVTIGASWIVGGLLTGDLPWALAGAVLVGLWGKVLWDWWRRRRQGKPSRVAALVKDLGHRLTVVPAHEGAGR